MENSIVTMVAEKQGRDYEREENFRKICECLQIPEPQMIALRRCLPDLVKCAPKLNTCAPALERFSDCATTVERVPELCGRLEEAIASCDGYKKQMQAICCPGQQLYGNVTLDAFSSITTVDLETIVTGLGDPYVDQFPVPTDKTVRMVQEPRPGYVPEQIEINLVLANGGTNYLNANIQFYIGDTKIGPKYKGSRFLDSDGRTKLVDFPHWRSQPVIVGTSDRLSVEISMTGPNSLEFATVTLHVNARGWYEVCST